MHRGRGSLDPQMHLQRAVDCVGLVGIDDSCLEFAPRFRPYSQAENATFRRLSLDWFVCLDA
ncbi:MAG: hypothetical protein ACU833_01285 [Gammaproteobacteria bacterium]